MTTRENDLIAELNDLRYLSEEEARLGVKPLARGAECLKPSDLQLIAAGQQVLGADEHLPTCTYCQRSLAALRAAMTAEPESQVPDPAVPDPSAAWVEGDAPAGRPKPAPARRKLVPKRAEGKDSESQLDHLENAVPVGYTAWAQGEENWPALAAALRSLWLPYLLEYVGLDPSHIDGMLSYIRQRIPIRPDQRLSELLPGWLVDFARGVDPSRKEVQSPVIDRSLVERMALRMVLEPANEDETDDQRRFREAARAQPFASVSDLLRFTPGGEELPREVLTYRSHLYSNSRKKADEGVRILQVA